ncbi:putative N-terminal acetyltransferase complex subunit ARD1 [Jaminaea rosea]|uniref:Putative N-terminal acetyltransferase complex subunit ARD1 n=1 Tax=Jaminaea rosea TaxID=1569628 RepID=A0A316URE5_9BASI|nr:putative N-terminal acetyltransferase complex subunit ARD1 [Jaminaea rosea]PWN27890.1 putative N-terminal acetyltransferase complex subunit ARD1 [Jaminaea rosea]
MDIRPARLADLLELQRTNLHCLPENYTLRYYLYHSLTWPQLSFVATDSKQRVVGYCLAKMEEEPKDGIQHGHVTSISVLRGYRRLGLAQKLMRQSQMAMRDVFDAEFVSLHVRRTNRAAIGLYRDTLGFEVHGVEKGYYADGEDALAMRLYLQKDKGKSSEV